MAEYRIEELAAAAGATVRTVQSYRNRHLLPPPRRQGRVALFSDEHLERLRLIADLIDRGYSLNAIGELLSGLHRGHDIADLLGMEAAAAQTPAAPPITVTRRELTAQFGDQTDAALRQAQQLGLLDPLEGDPPEDPEDQPFRILNPDLFQAGAQLVAAGIPAAAVLAEADTVQCDLDRIAGRFVRLVVQHLVDNPDTVIGDGATLTDVVRQLRPLAEVVVVAYLAPAIDKHVHDELAVQLDRRLRGGKHQAS